MSKFLQILQMIPALIGIVKSVEEVFPTAGQGAQKLSLIRGLMAEVYKDVNSVWPTMERLIAKIVTFFNAMGIFNKPDTPAE